MDIWRSRKWGTHPAAMGGPPLIRKTRSLSEYFNNSVPMQSDKLKIRMIKEGYLEPKCSDCGMDEWNGEEMPLQLNHIDGDNTNNSLKNLNLLCPNCHAQTEHWRMKDEHKGQKINGSKENRNIDT